VKFIPPSSDLHIVGVPPLYTNKIVISVHGDGEILDKINPPAVTDFPLYIRVGINNYFYSYI